MRIRQNKRLECDVHARLGASGINCNTVVFTFDLLPAFKSTLMALIIMSVVSKN